MRIDNNLQNDLQLLCEQLDENNFLELFRKGHEKVVEFKNHGGEKDVAYDTINELRLRYAETDEDKEELAGAWLDCICGYVGRKDLVIWK